MPVFTDNTMYKQGDCFSLFPEWTMFISKDCSGCVLTRTLRVLLLSVGVLLGGCGGLPENTGRMASHSFEDTADTTLGRAASARFNASTGESGFLMLDQGLDAFVARVALARTAERSIDAQYYLLHNDLTGHLFVKELMKAAERGVRVRLLVDDMDLAGRDESAVALHAMPNVEVRIFNPFGRDTNRMTQFVTRFGSVTRRMHNKLFIVDGQAVILGGRNIGDEYFEANPALAFGDLDVMGLGPVARHASSAFDAYWNHSLAYPAPTLAGEKGDAAAVEKLKERLETFIVEQGDESDQYFDAMRNSTLAEKLRTGKLSLIPGKAELVVDNPDKLISDRTQADLRLGQSLAPYFRELEDSLIIFSPYFVPGREGTDFLTSLAERGVRVRILTNSLASTDVPVVHVGYVRYRKELLRAGIELYEMDEQYEAKRRSWNYFTGSSKASLHAKSFVLDDKRVFVGSLNLDPRSLIENSEVGVVIESPEIAHNMAQWFEREVNKIAFRVSLEKDEDGVEQMQWESQGEEGVVRFDVDPYTCVWQRMGVGIMRLLPIDSQL